jgi:carbamoyltransferase
MPVMDLCVGLGGAVHNACVTLCDRDQILGVCEQERITRVRAAGFNPTGLPDETVDELLRLSGRRRSEVTTYAIAETVPLPPGLTVARLDHHFGHACAAYLPAPFDSATIVVCDHEAPQISVWNGNGTAVTRIEWPWHGPAFAEIYSQCADALGLSTGGHGQRMEALARLDPAGHDERVEHLFSLEADRLRLARNWQGCIESWTAGGTAHETSSRLAAALQSRIGDLLIDFMAEVKRRTKSRQLCVGGSLFYNSHFNTRVKRSGLFDQVFIPINPGNAGVSVGAAMHASGHPRHPVSPFLGPSSSSEEVKATLDNCKLTYTWASEADTIAIAVEALRQGRLVGWCDGPMEWGPRALGARSILANPFARYVLDNLNRFLKHRETWRGYSLSGLEAAVRVHFDGPDAAPFMECDYVPIDRERFDRILPGPQASVRVQTAGSEAPPRFRALLKAFGEATGVPILVNTSFNGFREPIVCSPRDAVRVFFGTGIDTLVLGEFVIAK